jgi:hypothetical protein
LFLLLIILNVRDIILISYTPEAAMTIRQVSVAELSEVDVLSVGNDLAFVWETCWTSSDGVAKRELHRSEEDAKGFWEYTQELERQRAIRLEAERLNVPIPEPTSPVRRGRPPLIEGAKGVVHIILPQEYLTRLKEVADGRSVSEIVRRAVVQYLDNVE